MDNAGLRVSNNVTQGNGLSLILPMANTQFISNLFMFRIAREWNLLPLEIIVSTSLYLFKKRLRTWLEAADSALY